jgi:C1A family cysteine protease
LDWICSYEGKFFDWLQEHGVQLKSGEEFRHRLSIFAANDDLIETHNAQNSDYKLGHNAFSMYTFEEFAEMMGLNNPIPEAPEFDEVHEVGRIQAPSSIDWVAKGAVTGVKNQGNCGSCWSFATTGTLEGAYKLKYGSLQSFSEQQLVSCDNVDHACNGGWMTNAYSWIKNNGGLCTESAYPYTSGTTGQKGTCYTSCSKVSGSKVSSWVEVKNSESDLMDAVATKPTAVAIDASAQLQMYKSGVFTGSCTTNVNHGVLAVGYGHDSGSNLDFWKVKNSWGTSWGEAGYIRIQRNVGTRGGKCGITTGASYVNL